MTFNKNIELNKGTFKIIVPDKSKENTYGKNKLGTIEVKMDGTSKEKALENLKMTFKGKEKLMGDRVTCVIKPDYPVVNGGNNKSTNRFVLELTQDWESILNTEKTKINYYDDRIKGLKLIAEGFKDENGNPIEDSEGSGEIEASRILDLKKDNSKPYVVKQKLIYNKIGMNGVQKAGVLGIVFNEPVQLYTKEMVDEGFIGPCIYKDHNPLTPNPNQIGKYENFLPELKAYYEKVSDKGEVLKDEWGKDIIVKGEYGEMADIFEDSSNINKTLSTVSTNLKEINHKFDVDPRNKGINRFRDYGMFYINPINNLSKGKWRLIVEGVSDDAGNEMDKYTSDIFEIKCLFSVEKLTKYKVKIKFTEPFNKECLEDDKFLVVVTQYGQIEAEGNFDNPIEDFSEDYCVNNISYNN